MLKNFLLDLIFPRFCLSCGKELNLKQASFICETCFNSIVLNGLQCHICGSRNSFGVCYRCSKKTFLNNIFSAGKYRDPILREMIHQFKYQSIESLKKPLTELLINFLKKENLIEKLQCPTSVGCRTLALTPIPLTWRRKLSRGFNQSELIAKELSPVLNCPVVNLLKRKRFTAPQARITDWKQRKENISGSFCLNPEFFNYSHLIHKTIDSRNQYRKVILVDDVSTSGATLEEAAKVLKEEGVKEVYGLIIAN